MQEFGIGKNIPMKEVKKAAIVGFIPLFGPFGVHDTHVGRVKQSRNHKLLAIPIFFIEFFLFSIFLCDVKCSILTQIIVTIIAYLPVVLFLASYLWAIYESVVFCQLSSNKNKDLKVAKGKAIIITMLVLIIMIGITTFIITTLNSR